MVTPRLVIESQTHLLEASPNAILAVDGDGRIVYVNRRTETTFGYDHAELIGEPVETLLPPRMGQHHVSQRHRFIDHPAARPMGMGDELVGRRRDGSEFPVEISLTPVQTSDGMRVFAMVVDITARKDAEGQLLHAQKLESIGRLAGGIAHDFNNMLFAIGGYAEILTADLGPDGPPDVDRAAALRSIKAIQAATDRATVLTSHLLTFGRRQVISVQILDLSVQIHAIEPMLRPLIGEQVQLELRLDPDAGHIKADPGQLDQILVNLIVNARDAMADGGVVTIETSNVVFDEIDATVYPAVAAARYVVLSVSDTGVGMDRATRERVFDPFFTTKEAGKGTGLGLATVYGIVREAGGHISLYSEPGIGTVFKIYFPRDDAVATEEMPPSRPSAMTGTGTILVVEDDPIVRELTSAILDRAGYQVTAVANGAEALTSRLGPEDRVDVLVTDVVMPDVSGIELAERVMSLSPTTGVVLLSGYTAETLDVARATADGAIFVSKPVTSARLLDAVARAIAGRREP